MNSILSEKQIFEIGNDAKKRRREFDLGMGPLGDNIFKLIRELGIHLIFLPVKTEGNDEHPFSALFVAFEEKSFFIGLNTEDYLDKQIFALAHELDHYFDPTDIHVCRISDDPNSPRELKANRFAAEFLLPTDQLVLEIKNVNQGNLDLHRWKHTALLRLIARLHCEYKLPYKAIVRRFEEVGSINNDQYELLLQEGVRDRDSLYYSIGLSMDQTVFEMLNTQTKKQGIEGDDFSSIIGNYEEGLISLSELMEDLALFNKRVEEFGICNEIDDENIEELNEFLLGHKDNEK
ncbi:MAG: ImmA/IrrE family metallo-endopeptidase [Desulfosporosinus sp.]|nr:ImmA/IrrE family metallo-endopeptidase [Desulfosporosinus sp.]